MFIKWPRNILVVRDCTQTDIDAGRTKPLHAIKYMKFNEHTKKKTFKFLIVSGIQLLYQRYLIAIPCQYLRSHRWCHGGVFKNAQALPNINVGLLGKRECAKCCRGNSQVFSETVQTVGKYFLPSIEFDIIISPFFILTFGPGRVYIG